MRKNARASFGDRNLYSRMSTHVLLTVIQLRTAASRKRYSAKVPRLLPAIRIAWRNESFPWDPGGFGQGRDLAGEAIRYFRKSPR